MKARSFDPPGRVAPLCLVCLFLLTACASAPQPVTEMPEGDYRERIQVQEAGGIRVSAAVPSAKESQSLFGKPLYKNGIQPVWLKIENSRDTAVTFLPVGLDPEYFPPLEVANLDASDSQPVESLVDKFFIGQSMRMLIPPGAELSGFVFTKLDDDTTSGRASASLVKSQMRSMTCWS